VGNGDKVVIKGKNNIVEFDYDSSAYKGHHHNTIVLEGNMNNITMTRKNVHDSYTNSHDKITFKGDSEKPKWM